MSLTPVEQADRNSRNRGTVMAIAALVLLALAVLNAFDPSQPAGLERGLFWALLVLLWLIMLATGGGLMLRRDVRRLMNDEVAADNRRRAIETGFWVAMAAAIGLHFASYVWPVSVRGALAMLTDLAIAAALLRYAWLELR